MKPFAIAGMQLATHGARDNMPYMNARLNYLMTVFPWVQMVVFSELAAFGPLTTNAQPLPGPAERLFQEMAARHEVWLITGSIFELHEGKIYNTSSVIDPSGRVVTRYRKMFPFQPYEVDVEPGDSFCVFDVPDVGRFGLSICYDMWFPETSRTLAALGAEVILHPSLTNTIDRSVELSIAAATAAQNQCFLIDINGAGDGGNGRSVFVSPSGHLLHQAGSNEELMPIEVDLDRVRRNREFGVRGLGQPLKSFRDCKVDFTVYDGGPEMRCYLETLGPLVKPERGSRVGIEDRLPNPYVENAAGEAAGAPSDGAAGPDSGDAASPADATTPSPSDTPAPSPTGEAASPPPGDPAPASPDETTGPSADDTTKSAAPPTLPGVSPTSYTDPSAGSGSPIPK